MQEEATLQPSTKPRSKQTPRIKQEKKRNEESSAELKHEADTAELKDAVKPKKKRRGPSGYALVGEDVLDTPADRRARLKAARIEGIPWLLQLSCNHLCC